MLVLLWGQSTGYRKSGLHPHSLALASHGHLELRWGLKDLRLWADKICKAGTDGLASVCAPPATHACRPGTGQGQDHSEAPTASRRSLDSGALAAGTVGLLAASPLWATAGSLLSPVHTVFLCPLLVPCSDPQWPLLGGPNTPPLLPGFSEI